jgi:RHS repeat-associated protein
MAKANLCRFSTKYQDDETDLVYYGQRYYNASTGRWLSRDPLAENGGNDIYCALGNAPEDFIDPFGLKTCRGAGVQSLGLGSSGSLGPWDGTLQSEGNFPTKNAPPAVERKMTSSMSVLT